MTPMLVLLHAARTALRPKFLPLALAIAVVISLVTDSSSAQPAPADPQGKRACAHSFNTSQKLRRADKLVAARKQLIACAQAQCPEVLRVKCDTWLDEVNAALPSVVFVAKGPAGKDTTDVDIWLDGERLDGRLDGKSISLDPGEHTLRAVHQGGKEIERPLVIAKGEQNRKVLLSFAGAENSVGDDESSGMSPLVYVGFGVGGVGLAVGIITGAIALSKAAELDDACPDKRCDADQQSVLDTGEALAHTSTAGFVVGGVGIAVGLAALLMSDTKKDEAPAAGSFKLRPVIYHAGLGLRGRF